MSKYACLIHLDVAVFEPASQTRRDGFVNAMLDNDKALRRAGNEAIRLAGDIQVATVGAIEVRPIARMERVDIDV